MTISNDPRGNDTQPAALRRMTFAWMFTVLALFPILLVLGFFMRALQAKPAWFDGVSLHEVNIIVILYVGSMAGVSYLLGRYVKPSPAISGVAFGATVLGVGLQYLPLLSKGGWFQWALLGSMAVLGVGWTLWSLDLLRAIVQRYSFSAAMGWHYLKGRSEPEVQPLVLIVTASLVAAVAGFVGALGALVLYLAQCLGTGFRYDGLLMRNLTFFFGHVLVYITMYLGVAVVCELLPAYAQRPWKTNKAMALAWNIVLLLMMSAYLHHLYLIHMSFVQPRWLQYLGQISPYMISLPAAIVSIVGALVLFYGSRMRWNRVSLLLCFGVLGWAIGAVASVIDSTVAINGRFSDPFWWPGHFHTYYLMGVVLMILGFASHLGQESGQLAERMGLTALTVGLLVLGGYGFLLMIYYGGAHSVPRYTSSPQEVAHGAAQARLALAFISALLAGAILSLWDTGRRYWRFFSLSA